MFKIFWLICGSLSLIIGVVGIVLPLLPTTPFILLAAASYAKSSDAFYNYLINNKYFGTIIKNWQEKRTVPVRAKIAAVLMMSISVIVSIIYLIK